MSRYELGARVGRRIYRRRPIADRLWEKIDRSAGPTKCWPWIASLNGHGYGHLNTVGGKYRMAHRLAYEFVVGPIPAGLQLDHLCRNRACCNPAHLEPVTIRENQLRSPLNKRYRTHCPSGHEYTPDNTALSKRNQRHCKTCRRLRHASWQRRRAEARRAA